MTSCLPNYRLDKLYFFVSYRFFGVAHPKFLSPAGIPMMPYFFLAFVHYFMTALDRYFFINSRTQLLRKFGKYHLEKQY